MAKKKWTAAERAAFAAKMAKYRKKGGKKSRASKGSLKAKIKARVKSAAKSAAKRAFAYVKRKVKRNPSTMGIGLFAQKGSGPVLHFNGSKLTNNGKPVMFPGIESARETAKHLVRAYPNLQGYKFVARHLACPKA